MTTTVSCTYTPLLQVLYVSTTTLIYPTLNCRAILDTLYLLTWSAVFTILSSGLLALQTKPTSEPRRQPPQPLKGGLLLASETTPDPLGQPPIRSPSLCHKSVTCELSITSIHHAYNLSPGHANLRHRSRSCTGPSSVAYLERADPQV